ncbi:HTH-type transcriptional regulator CysB [Candidatus Paraluminiphilus aquimaris]|uniref:HTH-type transcriptional regulator CysB n=1 Tax=Candidatus Paraluminiphilus aquimaris TaxID=2518994 RepID=A0ABY6Q6Z5_9GAMM|nr:HTH-type transcriptional regulator CysB [Candidatus Paraluminiphilus aquimaris]UZP74829.1 HTH-type transcriptional regulator CysB [Candidatus Paraluminiphilus aquimaris]
MKLQQLKYIWEVAHHDLNVSATAQSLFTSQPGISKQIRLLEGELGVEIFSRSGKHLTHITPAGEAIIEMAGEILRQTESIRRIAQDHSDNVSGSMSLATTHGQARYVLPDSISRFSVEHPDVSLEMRQGSPQQIAEMAAKGSVDFAIATEALQQYASLVTLPFFRWSHCVVVPSGHPLAEADSPTLEQIARYPLITYTEGFTGRFRIDEGFQARGLTPNYVVTAADADVIKTYVRRGLGVGIISTMAYEQHSDADLIKIGSPNYFASLLSCIAFRRGTFLRGFMFAFIEQLAPHLTADIVNHAMAIADPEERNEFCARLEVPRI